ncbi:MAG: FxsA family protein [Parvularculaceae bacterium]
MALGFIILLILGPIAEIYVLLKSGAVFGVAPVIAACLATAFLGAALLRMQGPFGAARGGKRHQGRKSAG